jgi:hypothetical protein
MMIHVQPLLGHTVPGTTNLLLLLQLLRYSSLILFLKHIKFIMNIWMNIIEHYFFIFYVEYNFIWLFSFFTLNK